MAEVTERDRQARICEGSGISMMRSLSSASTPIDTNLLMFTPEQYEYAIAQARAEARREGIQEAITVVEDYEGETNMQTGDFIHPNDLLPYHWADKIRALLIENEIEERTKSE